MSSAARTVARPDRLQLLSQPALPEVPGGRGAAMAGRPRGRAAACSLPPRRLHLPGGDRRHRVPEQGRRLRPPVQDRRRDADHDRRRSQTSGRAHRPHRRAAHLGIGADPPSARSRHRSRRRPVRTVRAGSPAILASSCRCACFPACSAGCSSKARRRPCRRTPGLLRRSRHLADRAAFARYLAPLRKAEWVVYAKRPFGGPEAVLAYLSRYTHRVAISNSRLLARRQRRHLQMEGLSRPKAARGKKSCGSPRRVHPPLPYPCAAERISPHSPLRPLRQRRTRPKHRPRAELLGAATPREQDERPNHGDQPEPRVLAHPCPCCGGRMIVIETFERGRAPRGSSLGEIRTTRHDRDRVIRNAATRLSFAASPSSAPLACARRPSGRLARTRPPRKTSSHRRRGTPLGYAPSVEIAFDGHRDHPPTAVDDSQIPIAPAGGYPPFRLAVSFFGGFRTPAPVPRDGKRPGRAGIRNPSHKRSYPPTKTIKLRSHDLPHRSAHQFAMNLNKPNALSG